MSIVSVFARPVDFFGRRSMLAGILGSLAAPAAALLGSKSRGGSIRPATLAMGAARPPAAVPDESFKEFVRTFNVGGLDMQVVTEWWDGRPADRNAIEDPEAPGVWVTQRIISELGTVHHSTGRRCGRD